MCMCMYVQGMIAVERMLAITGGLALQRVFALKGVVVLARVLVAKGGVALKGWFWPWGGLSVIYLHLFRMCLFFAAFEGGACLPGRGAWNRRGACS